MPRSSRAIRFHRFDRKGMRAAMAEAAKKDNHHFSHLGPESNLFEELEDYSKATVKVVRESCASICMTKPKLLPTSRNLELSPSGKIFQPILTCFSMRACTARLSLKR